MIEVTKDELIELVDWMVVRCEDCNMGSCSDCPVNAWKDKLTNS